MSTLAAVPVHPERLPSPPGARSVGSIKLFEPSVRYYYSWTPALIRAAEVAATSGNLRLAADLCEWMMGDDRVSAVLETRSDALLGLPFDLKPRGDGRTGPVVAREIREDWEAAFPEAELRKLHAWGLMLGVAVAQIVWHPSEDDERLVPHLEVWSPRWLSWSPEERCWMIEAVEENATGSSFPSKKQKITPGDGQWIVYTPHGASRPWVYGAYRALARWTLLKQFAIQDWGYLSERLGQGVWVAETDPSKMGVSTGTETMRLELAADLQSLGRNSAIALNPGQSLKLVESVARNYDSFRGQIELADNGTAVAILGQNLTTQAGTGGTNGAASIHGRVAHGRTRMDGKTLPTCLREQALKPCAEINYGNRSLAPRPWWNTDPIDDKQAIASVKQLEAQADVTLVNGGILTPNEARARRGLPPLPGGDDLKSSAAPAPAATESGNVKPASVENPTQERADAPPKGEEPENEAAE